MIKLLKLVLVSAFASIMFWGCSKNDYTSNDNSSDGYTLADATTNNCAPFKVNGTYTVGKALDTSNYLMAVIYVRRAGTYAIQTNTLNGYSFSGSGTFTNVGADTVKLMGSGTPQSAATSNFSIPFKSFYCFINVTAKPFVTAASYTLSCSGVSVNGTYNANNPVNGADTISIPVIVKALGSYTIKTTTVDGISFAASGLFTTLGSQNIILTATGKPLVAGSFTFPITADSSSCSQTVKVAGPIGGGTYTFVCSGFTANGTYSAGIPLGNLNTITASVNVTSKGNYAVSSNTVNGISFSGSGSFTGTGMQTIVLFGTGTPQSAGSNTFNITSGADSCSTTITTTLPANASFIFTGSPNACPVDTLNGTYQVNAALSSTNTMTVGVTVTTPGPYSIKTNTAGGISFSASGTFTTTGKQSVTLTGSGTPTTAGALTFTPTGNNVSGCATSITISGSSTGTSVFNCSINGVYTDFSFQGVSKLGTVGTYKDIEMDGVTAASGSYPSLQLMVTNYNTNDVTVGTYNNNAVTGMPSYIISVGYTDSTLTSWQTLSNVVTNTYPPFTITISNKTATRVQGTFSGSVTNIGAGSTKTLAITNGVFDLPVQ